MSNPIKTIAVVTDALYPYNKGGKEKRIYETTTRLAQSGYDVTIYCMQWWKGKPTRKENGVTLVAISPYIPLYAGERRSFIQAILFALCCFKLLTKRFDVLEADHMPHLVLFPLKIVSLLKRKKFIVTWNEVWGLTYWRTYAGFFLGTIAYAIEALSVRLPDVIISISSYTTKRLKEEFAVTKPLYTIPLGIDQSLIDSLQPSKKTFDVMYSGRLLAHKNVSLLLDAVALLHKTIPTLSCLIVGEGPEKQRLQEQADRLHITKQITFLPFYPDHTDLYKQMKSVKMFVLPSIREGFGIVAIEANACNIPVIVIKHKENAAMTLVNDGKNGLIAENTPESLALAIKQLLDAPKKKYTTYVQEYSWDKTIPKIVSIYNQ